MGHTLWLRFPGSLHLLGSNTCSNFSMQALKEILVVTIILCLTWRGNMSPVRLTGFTISRRLCT